MLNTILKSIFDEKDVNETIETMGQARNTDINLSSILDRLIHSAGRFAVRYSSDLFITWSSVINFIEKIPKEDTVFVFAVRKNGVDSNDFFSINIAKEASSYYREVFFLKVSKTDEYGNITVVLKNMTDAINLSDIKRIKNAEIQQDSTATVQDLPFE